MGAVDSLLTDAGGKIVMSSIKMVGEAANPDNQKERQMAAQILAAQQSFKAGAEAPAMETKKPGQGGPGVGF